MKGHIELGATAATLRPYLLIDPRNYRAMTANPMAARVSTGSQYGDLQAWSTFLMSDWQAGVGKTQAEAGGFLFGEVESRVPSQLILPAALGCSQLEWYTSATGEVCSYMPNEPTAYSTQAVGGTGNPTRISWSVTLYGQMPEGPALPPRIRGVAFYGYVPDGVGLTAALYSNSAGAPNASVASGTATASTYRPGYQWYWIPLSAEYAPTINGATTYHWVIYPTSATNQITVVQGNDYSGNSYLYSGSAWVANTGLCPVFTYQQPFSSGLLSAMQWAGVRGVAMDDANDTVVIVRNFENRTTGAQAGQVLHRYDLAADTWEFVSTTGTVVNWQSGITADELGGPVLFDGTLYWPVGAGYNTWVLATNTTSGAAHPTHLLASWAGYLWRAYNNQLWYSTDGTTWTAVANDVGPSDYRIRGMVGFGQYLYVATDEALYYVAPGDFVVGLFPWSAIDERNGRGMVVHQGALYIPVAGRILRYAEDGSLQDIWINRDDDLNNQRLGEIAALAGLSNWLVAGVNGTTEFEPASVWAYTQQGWHHLATLPPGHPIRSLYYDRTHSRLWIGTDSWAIFYIHAPDWAINPLNDSASTYMPHGWLETGRIYSGLRELRKDWESVRGFGEFATGVTDAVIYYQDADETTWTTLGTLTEDAEELRWSDYSTRPGGRWLKLGVLLRTNDPTETPKIEALATKLLPMITDRRAWNLAILISDDQQMLDGDVNTYTSAEMLAHLRGLVEQVPPFIYEDPSGTRYEVKATGSAENIIQYEYRDASQEARILWAFEIAIEQVTTGAYV